MSESGYETAQRLIANAKRAGERRLALVDLDLQDVPPEIGELVGLEYLLIRSRTLRSLPESIGRLKHLRDLSIVFANGLQELPESISALLELERLCITYASLDECPSWICGLEHLQTLNLSGNRLKTLPPDIECLRDLRHLNLYNNQLVGVPPSLGNLAMLEDLNLGQNRIAGIPDALGKLASLRQFDVSHNRLRDVPTVVECLSHLERLSLDDNQLYSLPTFIGDLTGLMELRLMNNRLQSIPESIGRLGRLHMLLLSGNRGLTDLPDVLGELRDLRHLGLDYLRLRAVPDDIRNLRNLEILSVNGVGLSVVPDFIGDLTELYYVEFNHNQLDAVPDALANLKRLQILKLMQNRLTSLPGFLGQLNKLSYLLLDHNRLTSLPRWIGQLTELETLSLSGNRLRSLPSELGDLPKLRSLSLGSNPDLEIPPELLDAPIAHVQSWLRSARSSPGDFGEAKVLLIGQGAVGKTSLVNRLTRGTFNAHEDKTEGINIEPWTLTVGDWSCRLNMWDFGGQEVMHATHQFFLSRRALYVLVVNCREDESQNRLYYWLQLIRSFGGDSPVLIVGNKCDQHPLDIDEPSLRAGWPNLRDVLSISCRTGEGISELVDAIAREVAKLPYVRDAIPVPWLKVRRQVEELSRPTLPYDEFIQTCEANGVTELTDQQALIRYLHDLGVLLHFPDDARLAGTPVLDPRWVTEGVYTILNDDELLNNGGVLCWPRLQSLLDDHRYRHRQMFIIDMMRRFELCFPLPEGDRWLLPDLLPKSGPTLEEWEDALSLELHYKVLPGSVVSRLMVRMHDLLLPGACWRTGMVVVLNNCRALVRARAGSPVLELRVSGTPEERPHALSHVRLHLDAIHRSFAGLEVDSRVPVPGHHGVSVSHDFLLMLDRNGVQRHFFEGLNVPLSVPSLLRGRLHMSEPEIFELLKAMLPGEFDEVLRRCRDAVPYLPGRDAPPVQRADSLVCWAAQRGRWADLVEAVLSVQHG